MMDAAEIARLPREKSLPELLRDWAKILDIPSGRFVNEDLEAAADALEQARKERAVAWKAVIVRDETINVTVKKLTAQRDQAQKERDRMQQERDWQYEENINRIAKEGTAILSAIRRRRTPKTSARCWG